MTAEKIYDLAILGAGSGGYAAALRAGQLGLETALIEEDKVGGTCLHRGCIPAKALLHTGEVADEVRQSAAVGVQSQFLGIDMAEVNAYKDSVISQMYKGLQGLLRSRQVDVIAGRGKLADAHTISLADRNITARNIVVATGSYPRTLGQKITKRVLTSTEALELKEVPESVIVLGGGVIGVEFASLWASYGAKVSIIEGLEHLVPNEDVEISRALERAFRKRGIDFYLNTLFAEVQEDEDGVRVRTQDGQEFSAAYLLIAIGRAPATDDIGCKELGLKREKGFLCTNERLATNIENIYAVGDVVPGLQLAHRGFLHGVFVAEEIAGLNPRPLREQNIPRVTFSNPEIASVGMSEKEAKTKYGAENIETARFNLAGNGKSRILGSEGFIKLVREKSGPILGFHALGKRIGEQIGEGELLVGWEAYPEDFANLIHAHPTQNEAIGEAIAALAGKPLHG